MQAIICEFYQFFFLLNPLFTIPEPVFDWLVPFNVDTVAVVIDDIFSGIISYFCFGVIGR